MILFFAAGLFRAPAARAQEADADKPKTTTVPALTLTAAAAADQCETDKAKPATSGEPQAKASKAANQQQEAMQQSIAAAQEAYQKEKHEMQERLKKDPLWRPSHEQVAVIKMEGDAQGREIHSFCRDKEGNLLICLAGRAPNMVESLFGKVATDRGSIVKVSPDGKTLRTWKLAIEPQAICLAADSAIYVGGSGKLCKLDYDGKVLASVDSAATASLPPLPEVKKEPALTGAEAEAAKTAKLKAIAEAQKKMQEAVADYQKIAREAAKDLKPNDEAAMEAYQSKLREPIEKLQETQMKFAELSVTPEQRAMQQRMQRERMLTITGMAVSERDLFFVCSSAQGFGFDVWRTDRDFAHAKKVVEHLAGCCGQMDVQSSGGDLWVAHNSRHKVEHYNRDGKKVGSFGKTDRTSADGFGGCCEPKNLRFTAGDLLFACESGPPTCVKRFSKDGKFLGVALIAPWDSGCVRVTTEYDAAKDRFYVLNSGERTIHVFAKKAGAKDSPETASLTTPSSLN